MSEFLACEGGCCNMVANLEISKTASAFKV